MLKKILTGLLCSSLLLSCTNSLQDENKNDNQGVVETSNGVLQNLDYRDDDKVIYNPDMGFYYRATIAKCTPSGIENTDKVIEYINYTTNTFAQSDNSFNVNNLWGYIFDLVHLEFDLSELSGTSNESGQDYEELNLTGIDDIFNALRTNHKTAIIRFAYDKNYDNPVRRKCRRNKYGKHIIGSRQKNCHHGSDRNNLP